MENQKLLVAITIAGIPTPPQAVDLTKSDNVEHALQKAIALVDLGDLKPGDGKAEVKTAVKFHGLTLPFEFAFWVE